MAVKENYLTREFLRELVCLQSADIWELATKIKPISPEHMHDHGAFKEALWEIASELEKGRFIEKDGKHAEELERKYREAGQLPEREIRYAVPYRIA